MTMSRKHDRLSGNEISLSGYQLSVRLSGAPVKDRLSGYKISLYGVYTSDTEVWWSRSPKIQYYRLRANYYC